MELRLLEKFWSSSKQPDYKDSPRQCFKHTKIMPLLNPKDKEKFIIVTSDQCGFGWAKMCADAGYEVIIAGRPDEEDKLEEEKDKGKKKELEESIDLFWNIGEDMIPSMHLDDIFEKREKYKDWYWIWDYNHNWEMAEQLRKEGFKRVFGGQELSYKCEKDRKFGTDLAKKAGLMPPETTEFSDSESGLEHLQSHPDIAFVFKPDNGEGAFTTYVPDAEKDEDANMELQRYLKAQDGETGTYILQERKKGTELNIELWLYDGKPIFAYCNLECKRKLDFDEGELVGSSQSIGFMVSLDCKLVLNTVNKFVPYFKGYTGPVDGNFIICDREYYFLEYCNRLGYDAHPNLFMNLAIHPFPEMISSFIDGDVKDYDLNFRYGFGATIMCYIDHPHKGFPLIIPEEIENKFYHLDTYMDEEGYCLSGYSNEVGYVAGYDFDIKSAGQTCVKNADKISYPMHAIRHDIEMENYASSPYKRYIALSAMKMFDPL